MSAGRRRINALRRQHPEPGQYRDVDGTVLVVAEKDETFSTWRRYFPHGVMHELIAQKTPTQFSDMTQFNTYQVEPDENPAVTPGIRARHERNMKEIIEEGRPPKAYTNPIPGQPNSKSFDDRIGEEIENRQQYDSYLKQNKLRDDVKIEEVYADMQLQRDRFDEMKRRAPTSAATIRIKGPMGATGSYTPLAAAKFQGVNASPIKEI